MRSTSILLIVSILLFAAVSYVILAEQGNEFVLTAASSSGIALISLCAALGCLAVWKRVPGKFRSEKRCWLFTALAFSANAAAELYAGYFELVLGVHPFGIPVVLRTLAYVLWGIGIIYALSLLFFKSTSHPFRISAPFIVAALANAGYRVLYRAQEGKQLAVGLYPSYDLVLLGLIAVLLVPLMRRHNPLTRMWALFGLTVLAWLAYDFVYLGLLEGRYYRGNPADILYMSAYLLAVCAAYTKEKLLAHGETLWR